MLLAEVKKLKVAELRAMLSERGLDTKGLKAELVVRLFSAIEAGVAPIKSGDEGENVSEATSTEAAEQPKSHSLEHEPSVRTQSPVCTSSTSKSMNAYADQSTQTDPPHLCSCTAPRAIAEPLTVRTPEAVTSRQQQKNPQSVHPVSLATVATGEEDAESSSVLAISEPEAPQDQDHCKSPLEHN